MSAVFLSDIDDYLSPSQACVNPIFTGSTTDKDKEKEDDKSSAANNNKNQVIPRAHRRGNHVNNNRAAKNANAAVVPAVVVPKQDPNNNKKDDNTENTKEIVKASIVDCLACSGCVTTAETVLLETHSLDVLRTKLYHYPSNNENNENNNNKEYVGLTISPASSADLVRRILLSSSSNDDDTTNNININKNLELLNRRLASMLCHGLNVHAVLDGNLALLWSLQYAANEFCNAYNRNKTKQQPASSAAGLTNNIIHRHETKLQEDEQEQQNLLPLITSSCPALVCLAEKTLHQSVPHLSSIKSPMSMAGSLVWKNKNKKNNIDDDDTNNSNNNNKKKKKSSFYHLAVMPCHDKKLEASRPELLGDVDMVITTEECYQLLRESVVNNNVNNNKADAADDDPVVDALLRAELLSSPLSSSSDSSSAPHVQYYDIPPTSSPSLVDPESLPKGTYITTKPTTATTTTGGGDDENETTFFPFSSGGYADYVFRYACQHLFNVEISSDASIWKPRSIDGGGGGGGRTSTTKPKTQTTTTTSARTAAAAQRRRQLYHAALYRDNSTNDEHYVGSWEQEASATETSNSKKNLVPVLRFVIAHGMQTMQRALEPFQDSDDVKIRSNVGGNNTSNSSTIRRQQPPPVHSYDYVEAMACPSGCMNGGGQIRSPVLRETPTQTRERVKRTHQCFSSCKCSTNSGTHEATTTKIEEDNDSLVHTTYRVVQPLQLQMGAAAGVAVKDMQW